MLKILNNVFSRRNKILLSEMVRTDFKLRYQNSILGYFWSLLKPLMLFAILYVVFSRFLRLGAGVPNYAISLLLGIVLWNFFTESVSSSLRSIVGRGGLIRKINIPRYLIPVSSIASAAINTSLNLIVVFLFIVLTSGNALSWLTIIIFPLLMIELIAIAVAFGFFFAAVYVKFRDIEHIWDVAKQALFYLVPIIYPLTLIPYEIVQKIIILNPIAQVLQDARSVTTYSGTTTITDLFGNPLYRLIPIGLVIIALWISSAYFRKHSKYFAEEI
jgi:ABC-2 type transport system permease protein